MNKSLFNKRVTYGGRDVGHVDVLFDRFDLDRGFALAIGNNVFGAERDLYHE